MRSFVVTLLLALSAIAQRATTQKKAQPPPPESPEHAFARIKLETHIREELLVCWQSCEAEANEAARIVRQILAVGVDTLGGYDVRSLIARRAARLDGDDERKTAYIKREETVVNLLVTRLTLADKCASLYKQTIDKKTSDLTIREAQQLGACQTLRLYPPETNW